LFQEEEKNQGTSYFDIYTHHFSRNKKKTSINFSNNYSIKQTNNQSNNQTKKQSIKQSIKQTNKQSQMEQKSEDRLFSYLSDSRELLWEFYKFAKTYRLKKSIYFELAFDILLDLPPIEDTLFLVVNYAFPGDISLRFLIRPSYPADAPTLLIANSTGKRTLLRLDANWFDFIEDLHERLIAATKMVIIVDKERLNNDFYFAWGTPGTPVTRRKLEKMTFMITNVDLIETDSDEEDSNQGRNVRKNHSSRTTETVESTSNSSLTEKDKKNKDTFFRPLNPEDDHSISGTNLSEVEPIEWNSGLSLESPFTRNNNDKPNEIYFQQADCIPPPRLVITRTMRFECYLNQITLQNYSNNCHYFNIYLVDKYRPGSQKYSSINLLYKSPIDKININQVISLMIKTKNPEKVEFLFLLNRLNDQNKLEDVGNCLNSCRYKNHSRYQVPYNLLYI